MTYTLPKQIKYWLSDARHDCFFLVGPNEGQSERIGALKHIIMGFSEPFRAMLQDSELAEPDDIRLIDVKPETFRNFLVCVYGGCNIVIPKLSFKELTNLLYVVEKYLVEDVKTEVLKQLCKMWSSNKIFAALSQPVCFTEKLLQTRMADGLKIGFIDISRDEEFLSVNDTAIKWILQQEHLNVCEFEIWMTILKWAKHQVNSNCKETLRLRILPFLKYVRFLAMDCKDFYKYVVPSGVLLREEIDEIIESFITGIVPRNEYLCKSKKHRYEVPEESENITISFMEIPNGGVIFSTIDNVSILNTSYEYSEAVCFAGFAWQLMVRRITENNVSHLSIFLKCSNYIRGWPRPVEHTCNANVTFTLLNQTGKPDLHQVSTHIFSVEEIDWGYTFFIPWRKALNLREGFVKENKLFVSTRIHINE